MEQNNTNKQGVKELFASIAPFYDRGNSALSFQIHRHWNRQLAQSVALQAAKGTYLDLCAGTGDIAFTLFKLGHLPEKGYLLDFCPEMLDLARQKRPCSLAPKIEYLVHDAEEIPLPSNSVDAITIAYGIRNLSSPERCFKEVRRVLKPSGCFSILELTRPINPVVRGAHALYLSCLLPLIGNLLSGNKHAYSYLSKTIQSFSSPDEIACTLNNLSFAPPLITPLTFGIATLITTTKK